jgi:hypothetical protein
MSIDQGWAEGALSRAHESRTPRVAKFTGTDDIAAVQLPGMDCIRAFVVVAKELPSAGAPRVERRERQLDHHLLSCPRGDDRRTSVVRS